MRVIKFRIWNNKTKEWIHGPHERPDLDGINILGENILFGNFLNEVSVKDLNEIEVLQYTGLNDKNHREIYEGDIVKFTAMNLLGEPMETVGTVKITEYNTILENIRYRWPNPPSDDYNWLGFYQSWDKEVIGNIFENPELCEK